MLILFDRLFGTYVAERADEPCRYGLVKPSRTVNPLMNQFEHWIGLFRDMAAAPSLGAALGYLTMPPGWQPDGKGETTENLRAQSQGQARALGFHHAQELLQLPRSSDGRRPRPAARSRGPCPGA